MSVFHRSIASAMPLLLALAVTLHAGEKKGKVDLKTRDKEKPVFVLVYGDTDDCKATMKSMENVAKKYDIKTETWKFDVVDEEHVRRDVLLLISVFQRLKIHQTNRAKQLYPHMVIYLNGTPLTYYPQARKGENTVSIDVFLGKLQDGEIAGIERVSELRRHLKEREATKP